MPKWLNKLPNKPLSPDSDPSKCALLRKLLHHPISEEDQLSESWGLSLTGSKSVELSPPWIRMQMQDTEQLSDLRRLTTLVLPPTILPWMSLSSWAIHRPKQRLRPHQQRQPRLPLKPLLLKLCLQKIMWASFPLSISSTSLGQNIVWTHLAPFLSLFKMTTGAILCKMLMIWHNKQVKCSNGLSRSKWPKINDDLTHNYLTLLWCSKNLYFSILNYL